MYKVIDEDYQRLDTYLCYECGFNYDIILASQKGLFQQFQKLFIHAKDKGINLSLKKYCSPTENQQRNKTPDDSTEPKFIINIIFVYNY